MSRTFSILNENNATLNPHGRTHLENGIFVDHCTRGQHASSTPTPAPIIKTDRIELAEVQLILSPGQSGQIVIRGDVGSDLFHRTAGYRDRCADRPGAGG